MKAAMGLILSTLLAACSQAPRQPGTEQQAAAAAAEPRTLEMRDDQPLTLTDGEGNELDPEVADAVREQMELREMEREEAGEGGWGEGADN